MSTTTHRRPVVRAVVAASAVTTLGLAVGAGNAVAGSLVTSGDIKDHTIKSVDVKPAALGSFQGLNGYVQVDDSSSIGANADGSAQVDCPGGKVPVGVTGYLSGGNEGVQTAFEPGGGIVYAHNDGNPATIYITVACASTP